ncbi:MAG TPA: PilW family protein [Usitatibacteraceae bacterium]
MKNASLKNRLRANLQGGFSLIELMIGMTLGLLVLAGLITVFVQSSQTRNEIERNNRQIESGRYAVSLLTEDLRMAGYLSSFDPYQAIIKPGSAPLGGGTPITAMPDPCNATLSGNASSWVNSYFFHIQGIDNVVTATIPSCLSDVKVGSDIVVIRRTSTCVAGPTAGANCDAAISGAPYFQASNCYQAGELATNTGSTSDYLSYFVLSTDTSATTMNKHAIDCTARASYNRYLVHIYFVANNNVGTDGVPTLKRAELGAGAFTIVPLVEGIENLQLSYGVDTDNDGVINGFTTDPGTYNSCAGAACVANWLSVYAVKINVLAKNTQASQGFTDSKTYALGQLDNGSDNTFGPFGDAYKRHVYNSVVRLDNPAGRRTP